MAGSDVPDNVIIPPPDIRTIVDKTANFVARHGLSLQERIRELEKNNQRFAFLNQQDPYHVYYQWRLDECKEALNNDSTNADATSGSKDSGSTAVSEAVIGSGLATSGQPTKARMTSLGTLTEETAVKESAPQQALPIAPEPFYFLQEIPPISPQDYEIIKLTALFTARNGQQFMNQIATAEARNHVFDFLKASHPLCPFFFHLVAQYQRVLSPANETLEHLEHDGRSKCKIVEMVNRRAEYARWTEANRRKAEDEKERERMAFASIDWHDFVIVDTIDLTDADLDADLPAPTSLLELQCAALQHRRKLLMLSTAETSAPTTSAAGPTQQTAYDHLKTQRDSEAGAHVPKYEDSMISKKETDAIRSAVSGSSRTQPASTPSVPTLGPMRIKSEPVQRKVKVAEITQVCPRCKQAIPVSEMEEHMRIELLDPKWREQRQIQEQNQRETNLAKGGEQVISSIKGFYAHRKDIFGGDELDFQKKIAEDLERQREEAKHKIIWDGHTGSIPNATQKIKSIAPINEQIASIHKAKGLVENSSVQMLPALPQLPPLPPPPVPQAPQAGAYGSMPYYPSNAAPPPMPYPYGANMPPYGYPGYPPPQMPGIYPGVPPNVPQPGYQNYPMIPRVPSVPQPPSYPHPVPNIPTQGNSLPWAAGNAAPEDESTLNAGQKRPISEVTNSDDKKQ